MTNWLLSINDQLAAFHLDGSSFILSIFIQSYFIRVANSPSDDSKGSLEKRE